MRRVVIFLSFFLFSLKCAFETVRMTAFVFFVKI